VGRPYCNTESSQCDGANCATLKGPFTWPTPSKNCRDEWRGSQPPDKGSESAHVRISQGWWSIQASIGQREIHASGRRSGNKGWPAGILRSLSCFGGFHSVYCGWKTFCAASNPSSALPQRGSAHQQHPPPQGPALVGATGFVDSIQRSLWSGVLHSGRIDEAVPSKAWRPVQLSRRRVLG